MPFYVALVRSRVDGREQDIHVTEPNREAALFSLGYLLGAHYHEPHELVKLTEWGQDF